MSDWTYAIYNLIIAGPVLLLNRIKYQLIDWRSLLRGYLTVSLPFVVWDMWATWSGHWSFVPERVLGLELGGIPVEEVLFFVTVPLACMFVWEVLALFFGRDKPIPKWLVVGVFGVISVSSVAALIYYYDKEYTQVMAVVTLLTVAALFRVCSLIQSRQFWLFQVVVLVLFVVFNLILSGLPVVLYSADHIIGWRFITIPIEDFFYNFAFLNLFLLAYTRAQQR